MTERAIPSLLALAALTAMTSACGDDSVGADGSVGSVTVDEQSPLVGVWSATGALDAAAPAEAVGIDAEGRLRAVVDGQVYVIEAARLDLRQRFADPGTPEGLGRVNRIRPRTAGGAWLATETGLWSADGLFVRHRPTDLNPPALFDVMDVAGGPMAGLWLAATDGVYRVTANDAQRIEADRPTDKLAVSRDAAVLVADGAARILTLDSEGTLQIADAPMTDTVADVAASADALFIATDNGLYRYQAGAWTQFPLSSAAPVAVLSLSVSGTTLWARTLTGVIRLDNNTLTAFPTLGTGPVAVDQLGDAYASSPEGLARGRTGQVGGEVVTFTANVLPWIEANCALCHANQTQDFRQIEVFRGVASSALTRVRSGDMPRCAGGIRCPPEDNLSPDEYSVLEEWIRAGLPE